MKKSNLNLILTLLFASMVLLSCKDETADTIGEIKTNHKLNLISNSALYESLSQADSSTNNSYGNTFNIDSFYVEDNWLYVIVGYSGGCEAHTFDIVWDGSSATDSTNYADSANYAGSSSVIFNIAIKHDANNDACEAYITDTLKVDLNILLEGYGGTLPDDFIINIVNGYSGNDGNCGTGNYIFAESEECILRVTAEKVVCGTGVWDDMWFRINRSTGANSDSLDLLLQPVALEGESLIVPEEGKTYNVGVFLSYYSDSTVTCLAYPGPSVPVKVFCYEEVE